MDMVARPSEIVTLDDENGVQTLLTRLVIPDVSIRRVQVIFHLKPSTHPHKESSFQYLRVIIQETADYEFKGKLVDWISQLWSLSKHSQNDLLTTGSGCGPQTCLSITNLSSIEVCCPFG